MAAMRVVNRGNASYFLQNKILPGNIVLNVTDLKGLWQVQLSEDEIIKIFKKDNPLIQSSDKWIAEYVSTLIKNRNTETKINVQESDIKIIFSSNVSSLSTKLSLLLHKQPSEMEYNEIILPLLMLVNELQYRQGKLISIIKAKDTEIKEFKFEGASITRKNAVTEPFNSDIFERECHTNLRSRAKDTISKPCSAIYPILFPFYNEFSSIANCINIKEEKVEGSLVCNDIKENHSNAEKSNNTSFIKTEPDVELKRKISESLSRTKRQKKSYKI